MSSLTRRIQRAHNRKPVFEDGEFVRFAGSYFMGRGSRVGVNNPKDKCLIASQKRELRYDTTSIGG